MTLMDVLLSVTGLVAVAGAVAVVATKQLVRAGLWLVVTLGAVAVEFLLLGAEFAAWVQVLIYVGAVVVLLLFAVMLTRAPIGRSSDLDRPALPAVLLGAATALGLSALFAVVFGRMRVDPPAPGTAERIGDTVFKDWVLPFELLSVLLLAALVGAIVLSRRETAVAGEEPR
ncbi:NADH-quinone oxidoreductase subunit J [Saccharothrix algeriensis]|uniref:NADH-quinone oxidoreductase subunit J n=2 Tax=Catellatospora bangladeshensis TaxID=310355 RepID=A0A8J3NHL5_9ACTN|nr:NADH dehydrogenase [Catellatospora bangladeshensis]